MDTVFIYCLSDPTTSEIRYVGKSIDPKHRLSVHIRERRDQYKNHWINGLLSKGAKPELEILEVFYGEECKEWKRAERWWISYLRSIGCRLTNVTTGGDGSESMTQEIREKLRVLATGRRHSDAARAKMSTSKKEIGHLIAASMIGKKRSLETIEKMRLASTGKTPSAETRLKMSLKRKGIPHSREWTEKISKALLARGERIRRERQQQALAITIQP